MADQWYFLDPDNRRNPPENVPYCARCHKPIDFKSEVKHRYSVHPKHPWIKLDPQGESLLGSNCWDKIKHHPISEEMLNKI